MLVTRCILVVATCALEAHGARLKKRSKLSSMAEETKLRQKSPGASCAEVAQHITDLGAVLDDPELTHQPTFTLTTTCLYNIPKDNPMVRFTSTRIDRVQMECKKRPDRGMDYAECYASGGGSVPCWDCGVPACDDILKLVAPPGWENWETIGVEKEDCSVRGFIERFKPLFNYPKLAQNAVVKEAQNPKVQERVDEFNALPDYLRTGRAYRKVNIFFWQAHRAVQNGQLNKAGWEDLWKHLHGDQDAEVMNWAVSNALAVQVSGVEAMKALAHNGGVTTKLAAHVGPIDEGLRMTQDSCTSGMVLFDCPPNDIQFTKGTPAGTWNLLGPPPADDDECRCIRTFM